MLEKDMTTAQRRIIYLEGLVNDLYNTAARLQGGDGLAEITRSVDDCGKELEAKVDQMKAELSDKEKAEMGIR